MSAGIDLDNVCCDFGKFRAVDHVNVNIQPGEFFSFLGPSGCGKTTILRMISGFTEPTEGVIRIGGKDVRGQRPNQRPTALIFQNLALFPLMPIWENIAFGLEMQKVDKTSIGKRVEDALRLVRLGGFEDRYPRQMSGGQQQRVALARALAIQPDILLLDEPLSNLDAKLRVEVRLEIRELQRKLGITTVLVTHDQEEALTMADRLVVISEGCVRQIGTKRDIYERPADRYVAGFIGRSFFIDGQITSPGNFRSNDGLHFLVEDSGFIGLGSLTLRPEQLTLGAGSEAMDNRFLGRVEYTSFLGPAIDVHLLIGESTRVVVQFANRDGGHEPNKDDQLWIGWAKTTGLVYPLANER